MAKSLLIALLFISTSIQYIHAQPTSLPACDEGLVAIRDQHPGIDCEYPPADIPLDDFAPVLLLIGGGLATFRLARKKELAN